MALLVLPVLTGCVGRPAAAEGTDTWRRISTALGTSQAAHAEWIGAGRPSFGASMTLRLAARGSDDRGAAFAARRLHQWRLDALQTLGPHELLRENPEFAARLPREQEVMAAIMERHGIASGPPAGWRPEIGSDEIGRRK